MKRDSILASVTGLFDSSTWAGKQGGAPASLPPADTPPMPHACSKTMSFPNPSLNTFTERLVLVAEDEPGIVGVLEAYLRRDGFAPAPPWTASRPCGCSASCVPTRFCWT